MDLIAIQNTAAINDYLSVAGLLELRQQIVAFHKEWDNFSLDVNNIIGQILVQSNLITYMRINSSWTWEQGVNLPVYGNVQRHHITACSSLDYL